MPQNVTLDDETTNQSEENTGADVLQLSDDEMSMIRSVRRFRAALTDDRPAVFQWACAPDLAPRQTLVPRE